MHWTALLAYGVTCGSGQAAAAVQVYTAEAIRAGVETELDPFTTSWRGTDHCREA